MASAKTSGYILLLFLAVFSIVTNCILFYYFISSGPRNGATVLDNDLLEEVRLDIQPQNVAYRSEPSSRQLETIHGSSQEIVIVFVSCGGRYAEVLTAIKSAILFAQGHRLKVVVFTEPEHVAMFIKILTAWQTRTTTAFSFHLHLITYPETEDEAEWKKLVVPCASQRLFFPSILTDVDAAIFVDADILFVRPLKEVWREFDQMNSTQEVALVREVDWPYGGYYEVMAKHPYYKPGGLNAGVMLMNLTRMRASHWTRHIVTYYRQYRDLLHSGDQDLINIYLYFHPDRVRVLDTRFNFRPARSYCDGARGVSEAAVKGAAILHGTGWSFHENAPIFQAIFTSWAEYELGTDPYINLYLSVKHHLEAVDEQKCDPYYRIFNTGMNETFKTT